MKRKRRNWLGVMGIALAVSLAATGCSGKEAAGTPQAKGTQGAQEGKEAKIEIVWANNFNAPSIDGSYVQKQLEEKFNITIKNVKFERQSWKDKFNILLASGQIPDIFPIDANETDMAMWADQGIIASVSPDEIKQTMPNYAKALEAVDAGAWDVGFYKGKNWGIPKVWPAGNEGFIPGYNEGWLKKSAITNLPRRLRNWKTC